jgi:predicted heme/steroid binding protein
LAIINLKNIKMKKIKYLLLTLFSLVTVLACVDNDNDELTGNATVGGYVAVNNPLVSYVVASGATYSAAGTLFQGKEKVSSIDIYKSFTNSVTGSVSNEVLLKTITIDEQNSGSLVDFSFDFTYGELITDLVIDEEPLPADDSGLNIGDYWQLRYASNTSEGDLNYNQKTTKVAVGTRYAGVYDTSNSVYWNSGSNIGNWDGTERIIESVNATVYRHVGLAYWDDNEFFFTVDSSTNVITVLDVDLEDNGLLLNTSPAMTCNGGTGAFESITCDSSTSRAIPDDVNGADVLEFTVGYFRGVGATREFFETLTRKVE